VRRPATILVVEDQPDQMAFTTHALKGAGYQVVVAYGGDDAIRKVGTQKIDLVVTDLAMPNVSGVEVVTKIKSNPVTQPIPVIVTTAYAWDQMGHMAVEAGCDAYINKPFSARRLVEEVQKQLEQKRPSDLPSAPGGPLRLKL